jgi:hypothetical protein
VIVPQDDRFLSAMNSVQLFASLLLVAAVAGQDYTYDYYEPEAVVPEPVAAVPEPAPVVYEPPQNKAVVAKLGAESADTACTAMSVKITMSDSSAFSSGSAVLDSVISRATMDATSIGRTFAITGGSSGDMAQTQPSDTTVLLAMTSNEDSSDCGHIFKRVATIAEAQLRVQEAIWSGSGDHVLASTATFDTPGDIPTVTDVKFSLSGKMVTEIGAYDHDEDFAVTTCNATTCVTKKVHSHRYDLPIADDDGPINGNAAEGHHIVGCVAYPTTPDSTVINDDGAGTVTGHGCYTSGVYNGHNDPGREANSGTAAGGDTSEVYATNIPVGSLDQSWVSSQYRDDDAEAVAAATRAANITTTRWMSRNGGVTGQYHDCLEWVAGQWTSIAGRTYATFTDSDSSCVVS